MCRCVDRTTKRKVDRKQPARKIEIAGMRGDERKELISNYDL